MPELPEVESIATGLDRQISQATITSFDIHQPLILRGPYQAAWKKKVKLLIDKRITRVYRRAKRLIIATDSTTVIIVQLGMTGKFLINTSADAMEKHTHIILKMSNNKEIRYIDPRRFGKVWFIDNPNDCIESAMLDAGMTQLGPEPFDLTAKTIHPILNANRPIKSLLLDQIKIAGLGNIYADEALFDSKIHPLTISNRIRPEQSAKLVKSIQKVLRKSISLGGTTFRDYKNPYGDIGTFVKILKVYQRTGQPCKRCKTPIEQIKITGRSSHFCPTCQVK